MTWYNFLFGHWSASSDEAPTPTPAVPYFYSPTFSSASALPSNLRRLREAKGWSVATLAVEAGISESPIRNIEANKVEIGNTLPNPTLWTLLSLAKALDVTLDALVMEERR